MIYHWEKTKLADLIDHYITTYKLLGVSKGYLSEFESFMTDKLLKEKYIDKVISNMLFDIKSNAIHMTFAISIKENTFIIDKILEVRKII